MAHQPPLNAMKKFILFFSLFFVLLFVNGQNIAKSPGLMLGLDSALIVREYSNFNNNSVDEIWEKHSTPGRIVYYCLDSKNKNKSNVAHVYDFNERGVNIKYTTISTQEKIKYAVDYFNNLALNRKNVYKFIGVLADNKAVWVSNDDVAELADCNCGNVKVTVVSNLKNDDELIGNTGVKPGKSGELLAIVYTPNK